MRNWRAILDFWFGDISADPSTIAERQSGLWWGKSAATDAEIRERFGGLVEDAGAGKLDAWKDSPEGWLSLIILTDQFPRNIFRDSPRMFGYDAVARALCVEGLEIAFDRELRPIQRVFFYLPLEHSEDAGDQVWCVDLMRELVREAPENEKSTFEYFVDFAKAHQEIIERFGRFPHRNSTLGRDSSAAEIEFLKQPGSSF